MKKGMRIKLISGDQKASFVIPDPPFPEVGDACQFMNREWIVTSIEPTDVIVISRVTAKISPCPHKRLNEDGISRPTVGLWERQS